MFDRPDHQALAELHLLNNSGLACSLGSAPPERRAGLLAEHWSFTASYRAKSLHGALVRALVLRALELFGRAYGLRASGPIKGAINTCAPAGCLCVGCAFGLLEDVGFAQAASVLRAAPGRHRPWMIVCAHRKLMEHKRDAGSPEERNKLAAAIAAFEELAVASGTDLEERPS